MKRVLISGAGGFLGEHLVRELEQAWEVVGMGRTEDPGGLADAVTRASPDLVVDAAFINQKPSDWSEEEYLEVQQATHLRLFDRCARLEVPVILISSSAVYGTGGSREALGEETPRRPMSLYGLAKVMQEMLGEHVAASRGLELCIIRLFNLLGPGRARGTVVPDWVARLADIVEGAEPVLRVKNRATSRDFVDVRDAARAVGLLARRFAPGEVYNVASGHAVSLRELGDYLESLCPVPYRTVETDSRRDAADVLRQHGDATKITESHGWAPTIDWRQSVREFWQGYLETRRTQ